MTPSLSFGHAETPDAILASFSLMQLLRPHLTDPAAYLARVERQQPAYRLLLAREDDRIVGLAGYRLQENLVYGAFLYIDDLVTLPGLRGSGVGSRLIAECQHLARAAGCQKLVLDTRRDNVLAQRFYFRNGMLPHVMRFSLDIA